MTDRKIFNLTESKLYHLCRKTQLLAQMIPDITVMMAAEESIEAEFPRLPEDHDYTRILINYTNAKGNSVLFKLPNSARMESPIDIDDVLEGYACSLSDQGLPADPEQQIEIILATALTFAASAVIGLDPEETLMSAKVLATQVLCAVTSIIYDDPLDVLVMMKEVPGTEGDYTVPTITNMWIVKTRQSIVCESVSFTAQ